MRPSRFERRILFAISVVVVGCLLGALGFGYLVVHDAFRMGVNDQVRSALDEGVAARRAHLEAMRELGERTAEWLANDARLREAVAGHDDVAARARLEGALATHSSMARIRLRVDGRELSVSRTVAADGPVRELVRVRQLDQTSASVDEESPWDDAPGADAGPTAATGPSDVTVVLVVSERTFSEFQRMGETADLLRRLARHRTYVTNVYVGVYAALVALISGVAYGAGLVLSRRVTRHIGTLAEATRIVGRGDLDVRVPVHSDDEIGELTRSFNAMVEDLRAQRLRIESLQRISAWQDFARKLAHEIKNPLTPIQLASQELASSYQGEDPAFRRKLEDARSIIEEEVATLRRLVTEFSSFARLPEVTLAPADLVDLVRDFERALPLMFEALFPDASRRPTVEVRIESSRLPVRLDAMMFRRALDNLVRNAAQATRDAAG